MFRDFRKRRPGPQIGILDPFAHVSTLRTGFFIPDINVKSVGYVNIFRTDKGQVVRKRVWAGSLPGPTDYSGSYRSRVLFALTPIRSDSETPSRSLSQLDWDMISIQPLGEYNQIYSIDLNDIPVVELPIEEWTEIELKMNSLKSTPRFAYYTVPDSDIVIRQELGYGSDSTNLGVLMQGVGITVQKLDMLTNSSGSL